MRMKHERMVCDYIFPVLKSYATFFADHMSYLRCNWQRLCRLLVYLNLSSWAKWPSLLVFCLCLGAWRASNLFSLLRTFTWSTILSLSLSFLHVADVICNAYLTYCAHTHARIDRKGNVVITQNGEKKHIEGERERERERHTRTHTHDWLLKSARHNSCLHNAAVCVCVVIC